MSHPSWKNRLSTLPVNLMAGGSDGLLITFILASGIAQWGGTSSQILGICFGYGLWASLAMTWAGYVAARGESHHYGGSQAGLLREIGLDAELVEEMVEEEAQDRLVWEQYQQRLGLPLERPSRRQAWKQGLQIGLAYLLGVVLILFPYLLFPAAKAFVGALVAGFVLVAGLGFFRGIYTGRSPWMGAAWMVTLAAVGIAAIRLLLSFL